MLDLWPDLFVVWICRRNALQVILKYSQHFFKKVQFDNPEFIFQVKIPDWHGRDHLIVLTKANQITENKK
jgi:hypothetical protein